MKFSKEIPTIPGYYWYVETEYPIPKIGYIYGRCLQEVGIQRDIDLERPVSRGFIRIGEQVIAPRAEDSKIEP